MIPILGSNYSIFKGFIISRSKLCGHHCDSILALVNSSRYINFNHFTRLVNFTHHPLLFQNSHCCSIRTVVDLEHSSSFSVCDYAKIFLTSKCSYVLFSNPTHKTATATANRWETTNSNPAGPIELSSQSTTGVRLCCALYQPQQTMQKCWAKTIFCLAKLVRFNFSSSTFYLPVHILSTNAVAVM